MATRTRLTPRGRSGLQDNADLDVDAFRASASASAGLIEWFGGKRLLPPLPIGSSAIAYSFSARLVVLAPSIYSKRGSCWAVTAASSDLSHLFKIRAVRTPFVVRLISPSRTQLQSSSKASKQSTMLGRDQPRSSANTRRASASPGQSLPAEALSAFTAHTSAWPGGHASKHPVLAFSRHEQVQTCAVHRESHLGRPSNKAKEKVSHCPTEEASRIA